jgi:hypothetical protein
LGVKDKNNSVGFFNSEFQREMGRRGGAKGGSKNSDAQYDARQKVGLTYGRKTGLGNQGSPLKEFLQKHAIWAYSKKATTVPRLKDRSDEDFFFVDPKASFSEVVTVLNAFVPDSIKNTESLHKLVYGERRQMYGWRIVNTLTRSEASEGIQEFYINNPGQFLIFESD